MSKQREPGRTSQIVAPTVDATSLGMPDRPQDNSPSAAHPGDHLSRWVSHHGKAVRAFVWMLVRDDGLADDLAQEVFCRAWEARGRYVETGSERAYLLRIADRLVCDHGRRAKRERRISSDEWEQIEPADSDELPIDMLTRREVEGRLRLAMDRLSEAQRRILLLRFFGGLQFHEIAEQIGSPLNTVLSHCHRGLLAMRKLMSDEP